MAVVVVLGLFVAEVSAGGDVLPKDALRWWRVDFVETTITPVYPVDRVGWYPDPLMPAGKFTVKHLSRVPAWVSLHTPKDTPAGVMAGTHAGAAQTVTVGGLEVSADCPLARGERPRLLLSKADLGRIRERIKGPHAAAFNALKAKIEKHLESGRRIHPYFHGPELAFLYALTTERKYAEALKRTNPIETLDPFALDLIWDTLTPGEIRRMAARVAEGIGRGEWRWFVRYYRRALLLYGTGHRDDLFAKVIAKRYRHLLDTELPHLNAWAADRGGDVNSYHYIGNHSVLRLWPDLHASSVAMGRDLWKQSTWSGYLASYFVYHERPDREEMAHLDMQAFPGVQSFGFLGAGRMMQLLWHRAAAASRDGLSQWWADRWFSGVGRIAFRDDDLPAIAPERFPPTRFFPVPGYVAMRSDWTKDAVLASFRCGAWSNFTDGRHCGWNNTFCIYKRGRLVMNTGAHHGVTAGVLRFENPRDPPVHGRRYASLTVASNGLLVRDPNDPLWPDFRPNDGGQLFGLLGGRWERLRAIPAAPPAMGDRGKQTGTVLAYETSPRYDYACGDATLSYSPKRVEKFTRQFLFLRPDLFVIFDRVTACEPRFRKTWVMHTPEKLVPNAPGAETPDRRIHPAGHFLWNADGGSMTNTGGGRLFWKTLLPEAREVRLLGGEGHDFEVEGVNRGPTPRTYKIAERQRGFAELAGVGGWRIEVESTAARKTETFLNVLQAADVQVAAMVPVERVDAPGKTGVRLSAGKTVYEVSFATEGAAAGHIRIVEGGKVVLDLDLADQVEDNYTRWKNDPRYTEWMTNPAMRTVIGATEQDAYKGH